MRNNVVKLLTAKSCYPIVIACYIVDADYSLPAQSLSVTFSSMDGERFCIDISTIQDTIDEGTEQFELYFENLPSAFANVGNPNISCVDIEDDDGKLMCVL